MSDRISLNWRNPHWGGPDLICPHCGCEWNVDGHSEYDSEYGYFMLEDGVEIVTARCEILLDLHVGCGKEFKVIRTVKLSTDYKVKP